MESEAETVIDLTLNNVHEDEKLKVDFHSQWNLWRMQVSYSYVHHLCYHRLAFKYLHKDVL
jgi:hypothetical protein